MRVRLLIFLVILYAAVMSLVLLYRIGFIKVPIVMPTTVPINTPSNFPNNITIKLHNNNSPKNTPKNPPNNTPNKTPNKANTSPQNNPSNNKEPAKNPPNNVPNNIKVASNNVANNITNNNITNTNFTSNNITNNNVTNNITTSNNITNKNVTNKNITSNNVTNNNATINNATINNATIKKVSNKNITNINITNSNVTNNNVTTNNATITNVPNKNITNNNVTNNNVTNFNITNNNAPNKTNTTPNNSNNTTPINNNNSVIGQRQLKVYMYPLNKRYNVDISNDYGSWNQNIEDELGLGIQLDVSKYAYNTNQFALEQYFYYRLTHSGYHTDNITEADLYYIPFFANLAKMNSQYPLINDFWREMHSKYQQDDSTNNISNNNISTIDYKYFKSPYLSSHFIVNGGCQPFAELFFKSFLSKKITMVMLERTALKNQSSNVIVAPYPGHVHAEFDQIPEVNFTKKTLLASSVWNSRYPFRWYLSHVVCMRSPHLCEHLEIEANSDNFNHSYAYELLLRSVFCLNPSGDSATRKAFWDALLVGCINVIYDNTIKYPFDNKFNFENMTVFIPKKYMNQTLKILSDIPKEKVMQMQAYINTNRIHFQYSARWDTWKNNNINNNNINNNKNNTNDKKSNNNNNNNIITSTVPEDKKDAFLMLLDEVYQKSKSY